MKLQKIQGVVDTVKERDEELRHPKDALDILYQAQQEYMNHQKERDASARCYRFVYDDQWGDLIKVDKDKWVTERDYLVSIGQTPLQNNLIQRLVNSVLGVYWSQSKEPTCVARDRAEQEDGEGLTKLLQVVQQRNRMKQINASTVKEFLIKGIIAHRKAFGSNKRGDCDVWTDVVNPDYLIWDSIMRDPRGWDCSMIGEIHDMSFKKLTSSFARTAEERKVLAQEYSVAKDSKSYGTRYTRFFGRDGKNNFLVPSDPAVCRVFEIWTLENKSKYHCHDYMDGSAFSIDEDQYQEEVANENAKRIQMARQAGVSEEKIKLAQDFCKYVSNYEMPDPDMHMPEECALVTAFPNIEDVWYYRFLTPTGMVLQEGESPFAHGGHPYVVRFYPFTNGEIHSFVESVIDPQKQINRTCSQIDMMTRAGSKGALLVPSSSIPKGSSAKEMNKEWSKPTAVIEYNDEHGRNPKPTQENSPINTAPLQAMLQIYQQLMEDGGGIHGAMQGRPGASAVSGVLYQQQAQNSAMTLLDLLDTISGFEEDCALMDCQLIQQYYDEQRIMDILGEDTKFVKCDPKKIKRLLYDIAVGESTATPAYRQLANDYYNQWLAAGLIDLEQALEFGNFPNADALLQSIRTKKQQQADAMMQQQQQAAMQQMPQEEAPAGYPQVANPYENISPNY